MWKEFLVMETLPIKYLIMLISAVIIAGAVLHLAHVFSDVSYTNTVQLNQTMQAVLERGFN
jgi:hypothetical protein